MQKGMSLLRKLSVPKHHLSQIQDDPPKPYIEVALSNGLATTPFDVNSPLVGMWQPKEVDGVMVFSTNELYMLPVCLNAWWERPVKKQSVSPLTWEYGDSAYEKKGNDTHHSKLWVLIGEKKKRGKRPKPKVEFCTLACITCTGSEGLSLTEFSLLWANASRECFARHGFPSTWYMAWMPTSVNESGFSPRTHGETQDMVTADLVIEQYPETFLVDNETVSRVVDFLWTLDPDRPNLLLPETPLRTPLSRVSLSSVHVSPPMLRRSESASRSELLYTRDMGEKMKGVARTIESTDVLRTMLELGLDGRETPTSIDDAIHDVFDEGKSWEDVPVENRVEMYESILRVCLQGQTLEF